MSTLSSNLERIKNSVDGIREYLDVDGAIEDVESAVKSYKGNPFYRVYVGTTAPDPSVYKYWIQADSNKPIKYDTYHQMNYRIDNIIGEDVDISDYDISAEGHSTPWHEQGYYYPSTVRTKDYTMIRNTDSNHLFRSSSHATATFAKYLPIDKNNLRIPMYKTNDTTPICKIFSTSYLTIESYTRVAMSVDQTEMDSNLVWVLGSRLQHFSLDSMSATETYYVPNVEGTKSQTLYNNGQWQSLDMKVINNEKGKFFFTCGFYDTGSTGDSNSYIKFHLFKLNPNETQELSKLTHVELTTPYSELSTLNSDYSRIRNSFKKCLLVKVTDTKYLYMPVFSAATNYFYCEIDLDLDNMTITRTFHGFSDITDYNGQTKFFELPNNYLLAKNSSEYSSSNGLALFKLDPNESTVLKFVKTIPVMSALSQKPYIITNYDVETGEITTAVSNSSVYKDGVTYSKTWGNDWKIISYTSESFPLFETSTSDTPDSVQNVVLTFNGDNYEWKVRMRVNDDSYVIVGCGRDPQDEWSSTPPVYAWVNMQQVQIKKYVNGSWSNVFTDDYTQMMY